MSLTVTGKVEYQDIASGVWALASDSSPSEFYELKDAPPTLLQPALQAKFTGLIRDDVMSLAQIGPVLEVNSFEII